jgi:hypothetical protein
MSKTSDKSLGDTTLAAGVPTTAQTEAKTGPSGGPLNCQGFSTGAGGDNRWV